ncbi:MAG TPA: MotA/TolQ/ExbB proton channel family protein, partial [Albitalea sp.]|nr:MotA/TolQ/ExbB proton channel family protein [Albitalea sp.]
MSLNKLLGSRAAIALTLACWLPLAPLAVQAQASAPAAAAADASAPAVAAAPAPVPAPLVATTSKETIDNPYGLSALWQQGDFVARGTLMILVIM